MRVSDAMVSDLVTVSPDASLRDAFRLMSQAHVRHLPVVRDRFRPDLALYVAGADPYAEDQIGGLSPPVEADSPKRTDQR